MAADEAGPAARLTARAGVQRFPNRALELFVVRHFLSDEECAALCALIDEKRRPSTIADDQGDPNFRTSETCDLDGTHPLVARVRTMLSELTGIPLDRAEPIQGQHYAPGQEFKPHTDTFNPGGADFFVHTAAQGQRTWTAMLYLNQPEDGGATRFKTLGKTIQAEVGKLLLWNNLLPNGKPNNASLHQGMRVRKGAKYIITQWYRERAAS